MLVPCDFCQTPVARKPNQIARQAHVYCSVACRERGLGHAPSTTTPCANCGDPVTRKPSDRKHRGKAYTHTYCSNACRSVGHRSQQAVPCAQCGETVMKHLSALARTTHSFCSVKCYHAFPFHDPIPVWDRLPDPTVLAYIAGMLDGDGSISINRGNSQKIAVRLGVTYKPVLEWMQNQFPGESTVTARTDTKAGHKPMYDWTITGNQAVMLLEPLAPFLLIKRDEAERAIAFQRALHRDEMSTERIVNPKRIAEPSFPTTDAQMAYCAGFFDAEGYIGMNHHRYWNLGIAFSNSNWAVLNYIATAYIGGSITQEFRRATNHAQVYALSFYGTNAVGILKAFLPYLHIKLERAVLTLRIHDMPITQRRTEGLPFISQFKRLNKRGI